MLLDDLRELVRNRRQLGSHHLHAPIRCLLHADDVFAPFGVFFGKIDSRVGTAALLAGPGGPGARFANREEMAQVQIRMPPRVESPIAHHGDFFDPLAQLGDFVHRLCQGLFLSDDADLVLHEVLKLVLDLVGADALATVLSLEGDRASR